MKRFLRHLAGTLALMAACTVAALAVIERHFQTIPESNLWRPWFVGETYWKLNEAQLIDDVDILFLGSSHAMRAFDPRVVEKLGVSAFNLATSAQTPVNSGYVLKAFGEGMSPELVVLEVYWDMLRGTGMEAAVDLIENGPVVPEFLVMALDVGSVLVAMSTLRRWTLTSEAQARREDPAQALPTRFVGNGFREVLVLSAGDTLFAPRAIEISPDQEDALGDIAEEAARLGAQLVWVTAPMPRYTTANILNLEELRARTDSLARSLGVPYFDFTRNPELTAPELYYDYGHLNARGAARFMPVLVDSLRTVAPEVFQGRPGTP